jgi:uncharacterized protein (DUF697 family)
MSNEQHPAFDPANPSSPLESTAKVHPASQTAKTEAREPTTTASKPLAPPPDAAKPADFLQSMTDLSNGIGQAINETAFKTGQTALETVTGIGESVSNTASEASKLALKTTTELGEVFTTNVSQAGKAVVNTASVISGVMSDTTVQAGMAIAEVAKAMGDSAAKQIYQWLGETTKGAGQAIDYAASNPVIRRVSGVLKLDWIAGVSDRVDLEKAAAAVRKLQQQHPDESPSQIAHRIMVNKAIQAGGMGFASSILPGFATALLAVDLAATTAIQSEMVYQIAAAYGMDLQDPARRGEVLGIFGLALGGRSAIKAGLAFMRNVPIAGAMIGASTNATMLYSLGYAACRFYEAKQSESTPEPSEATLDAIKQESDKYLEVAAAQQVLMDQILVHMILASYPEKTWDDILPELRSLQISETSLEAIERDIQAPQPLGALLDQLNRDFAVPLLAQCNRIAMTTREISPAEMEVMTAIAQRFDIDMDHIQAEVSEQESK